MGQCHKTYKKLEEWQWGAEDGTDPQQIRPMNSNEVDAAHVRLNPNLAQVAVATYLQLSSTYATNTCGNVV